MQAVREKLEKMSGTNVPVLIHGESGTGKEVVARLLHCRSPWSDGPFVKVNCPAIPSTLLESELFGYEKGAFTGAYGMKPGRVELAHRGTLFMDEIAELDPGLQAKLLQVLQDGQFSRIGAQEDTRVEVRLVCATNRDLETETENGTFRRDLYYRINVLNVHLPCLRERRSDIPDLVNYMWHTYNEQFNCQTPPLSSAVMQQLQAYDWPGNIRQLQNLIKRYVILGSEESVTTALVVRNPSALNPEIPEGPIALKKVTRQAVRELEGRIILKALQAHSWNRKQAARALSISYRALLYKIHQAGLPCARDGTRIEGFTYKAAATN
jgi:two-component system response regulator AtoC